MAEQKLAGPAFQESTVTAVDWAGVLEFVHLFRAFRLAIHPMKIVVGMLALVLIYLSGWVFDGVWGPQVLFGRN